MIHDNVEIDPERGRALLHRPGTATTRIADEAETNEERLNALGEAQTEAGEDQSGEEDAEKATAPTRTRKKP